MDPQSVRVAVVDDHKLVAETIAYTVERFGFDVVGITHSGKNALEFIKDCQPDVVLLDVYMPGWDGFDVARRLRQLDLSPAVIMLTSSRDFQDLSRANRLGVSGFLSKDASAEEVHQAVLRAARGESLLQEHIREIAASWSNEAADPNNDYGLIESLTHQETRVLRMLADGLSNDEIATLLTVSTNTVKTHLRHIFQKLQVSDRTSAAVWAARHGLVPLDTERG